MPFVHVGNIDLCYESTGSVGDPTVLLIHGLGGQLLEWDEPFCRELGAHGYRVVRFDQRDSGLSSSVEAPKASLRALMAAVAVGVPVTVPYDLGVLASDASGLLDALGVDKAHVIGISMGGMVAQTMAIEHAERLRSLVSIMSTTGDPTVGQVSNPQALAALMTPPPADRIGAIEYFVAGRRALCGGAPFDARAARAYTTTAIDRAFNPAGTGRQFAAIVASGDRTERLRGVATPTLVLHGTLDPLIDISGGKATAAAIPGSRFVAIAGMGHQIPFPAAFREAIVATITDFLATVAE